MLADQMIKLTEHWRTLPVIFGSCVTMFLSQSRITKSIDGGQSSAWSITLNACAERYEKPSHHNNISEQCRFCEKMSKTSALPYYLYALLK